MQHNLYPGSNLKNLEFGYKNAEKIADNRAKLRIYIRMQVCHFHLFVKQGYCSSRQSFSLKPTSTSIIKEQSN